MKYAYIILHLIAFAIVAPAFTGCKKETPANQAFIGTYSGSDVVDINSGGPIYNGSVRVLASGVDAQKITLVDSMFLITLTGVISGNSINNITGSSLALLTSCATETFQGSGSLVGNTLSYTIYGSYYCNNGSNNGMYYDTLSFTGYRP